LKRGVAVVEEEAAEEAWFKFGLEVRDESGTLLEHATAPPLMRISDS
jgi:hypothetical protein